MKEKCTLGMARKNNTSYNTKKMRKKVGFADIIRRGALPNKASIHIAKVMVLREIHKREDKRWIIYTDSLSSMQIIEYNKENHSILNQI